MIKKFLRPLSEQNPPPEPPPETPPGQTTGPGAPAQLPAGNGDEDEDGDS